MSRNGDRKQVILPQIQKNGNQDHQNENYNFIATKKKSVGFKDKDEPDYGLVDDLKKKIEEQKKDIEQRNQAIFSIQRNFESLSALLKKEKQDNQALKDEILRLKESNIELLGMIKVFTDKAQETKTQMESLKSDLDGVSDERRSSKKQALELQNMRLKSDDLDKLLQRKQEDIGQLMLKVKEFNSFSDRLKISESEKNALQKQLELLNDRLKESDLQIQTALTQNQISSDRITHLQKIIDANHLMEVQSNQTIMSLKSKENTQNQSITSLSSQVDDQKKKIKQLNENLESQKAQLIINDQSEGSNKQSLLKMSQKQADKDILLEQYTKTIELLQNELASYSPYKEFIQNLKQLQEQCQGGEIKLIPQFELQQIQSNLSVLQQTNQLQEQEISLQAKNIMSLTQSQVQLEGLFKSIQQKLNDKEQELDQYQKALSDYNNQKTSSDQNMSINQDLLTQSQERNKKQSQQINQLEFKIVELKKQYEIMSIDYKDQSAQREKQANQLLKNGETNEQNSNELLQRNNELINLKERLQSHIIQSESLNKQLHESLQRQETLQRIAEQTKEHYDQKLLNLESQQGTDEEQLRQLKTILGIKEREYELKNLIIKENEQSILNLRTKFNDREVDLNKVKLELDAKIIALQQAQKELIIKDDLSYKSNLEMKAIITKVSQLENQIEQLNPAQMKKQLQEIEKRDKDFKNILCKIEHAQESTVTSITCSQCMEFLNSTITCVPCGHSFCQKCPQGYESGCSECSNGETYFKNKQMDDIVAKIKYSQATLKNFK